MGHTGVAQAADLRVSRVTLRNKSNNLMNVARGVFYKDFIYKLEQWQPEEAFLGNEETAWR